MNYYAIIPARGGSKRIPRKNLVLLKGMPLIYYTIKAALTSKKISRTIVSTDDNEIADYARFVGAEVPFIRPDELSSDKSTQVEVLQHALEHLQDDSSKCDAVILLQPTSPFRNTSHIDESIAQFEEHSANTLISVRKMDGHPLWTWKMIEDRIEPFFSYEHMAMQRHQMPLAFVENGAIFIIEMDVISKGIIYGKKVVPYLMDKIHSIDIDTIEDLQYAEYILNSQFLD